MGWAFDAGPLHFGSDGVGVRPQMKVGYKDENVHFAAGLDDLRDGISGGVMGRMHRKYAAEGHSMEEVLRELKSQSQIRVLDDLIRLAPKLLSQIMHMTGVDIPKNSHVAARVLLKFGVGISGGVCLGWADTKGFHMVGCRGQVSAAASIGADIMAGLHHTRRYVKAILGISNICVELVFELPAPATGGVAGSEGEVADAAVIANTVAAGDEQRAELGVDKPVTETAAGAAAGTPAAAEATSPTTAADAPGGGAAAVVGGGSDDSAAPASGEVVTPNDTVEGGNAGLGGGL